MKNNITFRLNTEKDASKIKIEDTFEITKEEFNELPIKNRFSAMWNQQYIDLSMYKYSYIFGILSFLFISISELYMLRNYVIMEIIHVPETRYWAKVACCYLWYIVTAHWLCVLLYSSQWSPEKADQIELQHKTLWDDYDETLKALRSKRIIDKSTEIPVNYKKRMIDYLPDQQSGLQWKYCVICQMDSPPRTHHCIICNKCILKRDHHCFITGQCIGHRNQRYFYFLCLFGLIGVVVGFLFEGYYVLYCSRIGLQSLWKSLFIFNSIYMWLWTGEIEIYLFLMILHLYIFPLIAAMCLGFVCLQTLAILKGITSDELKNSTNIRNSAGFIKRWQECFGPYWVLNFLLPSQIICAQTVDGINWPEIVNLDGLALLKKYKE